MPASFLSVTEGVLTQLAVLLRADATWPQGEVLRDSLFFPL